MRLGLSTSKRRGAAWLTTALRTWALAVATIVVSVNSAPAGDFFQFFFGGSPPHPSTREWSPTAYADPATPFRNRALREPSSTLSSGDVAYCVRLCDGRYFPIQRHVGADPAQLCTGMCPASKTKIFNGTDIDHASGNDGKRYADLENAFVYRQRLVDNCTCNGKDAFGTAHIDLASDPTLRAGDIVATANGLAKVSGARKAAAFTPIDKSTRVDNMMTSAGASTRGKLAKTSSGSAQD